MARNKNQLKLFFWSQEEMSQSGLRQWSPQNQIYVKRVVYRPALRVDVYVEQIANKEKVCELTKDLLGEGIWIMRGVSRGKTRTRYKWVRLAKIEVFESGDELKARISDTRRLSRYWFWGDDYETKSVY